MTETILRNHVQEVSAYRVPGSQMKHRYHYQFCGGGNGSPVIREYSLSKTKKSKQPKLQKQQGGRDTKLQTFCLSMEDTLLFFKSSLNISTLGRNQSQNICLFKLAYIYPPQSQQPHTVRYTPRHWPEISRFQPTNTAISMRTRAPDFPRTRRAPLLLPTVEATWHHRW